MARKKTHRLKLELYNADRKMKNVIRYIFKTIIPTDFIRFCKKINFKTALEYFASVDGHLGITF